MTNTRTRTLKDKVSDPQYQPTKAELEEDISVKTTPEKLADAVLGGGAERREPSK